MASSTVSNEDLEKKQTQIQKLREQIRDAATDNAQRAVSAENEIVNAQLDAEITNLQAQLRQVKADSSAKAIKAGTAGPLAQAKDQLAAATAAGEAPVGPVDTNKTDKE